MDEFDVLYKSELLVVEKVERYVSQEADVLTLGFVQ